MSAELQKNVMSVEVDGHELEVVHVVPGARSAELPPLLLVHGVFHGAWCWDRFQVLLASVGSSWIK